RSRGTARIAGRFVPPPCHQDRRIMSGRDFTERDIHMALDGELPGEDRAGYEAWLAANPDMQARRTRYAGDADALRSAFAGVLDEPVPARLTRAALGEKPMVVERRRPR